jgi:hypothetical protein
MSKEINKKCFSRKTNFGKNPTQVYAFCVDTNLSQIPGSGINRGNKESIFCDATKGSQGIDNTTKYVYELINALGKQKKLAYVECNYVE